MNVDLNLFYTFMEYFASFVEIYFSFIFFRAFLVNAKSVINSNAEMFISFFMALVLTLLGKVRLFSAFNTLFIFLFFILIELYIHRQTFIKTAVVSLSYFALMFIIDLMISSIVAIETNVSISDIFTGYSGQRTIAALCSKAVLAIICMTILRLSEKVSISNRREVFLLGIFSVLIIMISSVLFFTQADSDSENINFMMMVIFTVMLALICAVYFGIISFFESIQKKQENILIHRQNRFLECSLVEQENAFSLWRKSVHDYKNTIFAIDSLLKQGKTDELSDFVSAECAKFENRADFVRTGNITLDTIINSKYSMAKKKGITFMVNAAVPEKCAVSDIHLAALVGNLIDNAIEAQENEREPYIHINFSTVQDFLIIRVVNKCSTPPEDLSSSKKDKDLHGIGLKSIEGIVEIYDGEFNLEFENSAAAATVMMKNIRL